MYILLVFLAVLVVFSMVQNNRKRKQTVALQQAIEPGARVMTTSGIYGVVSEVESDTIVLEISEGIDVRFAKQAVMRVVPDLADDTTEVEGSEPEHVDGAPSGELTDADLHAELDAFGAHDSATDADPSADGKPSTPKPVGRDDASA